MLRRAQAPRVQVLGRGSGTGRPVASQRLRGTGRIEMHSTNVIDYHNMIDALLQNNHR